MKQKEIKGIPNLIGSIGLIKAAAVEHEEGIPLLHNTSDNIGTDADALTTTRNNHEQGKVVLANYRAVLATIVFTVRAFLTLGRDILKPVLGSEYSQAFDVLGFVNSLAIPRATEDLLALLQAFKAFFVANPTLEDATRNITAGRCQVLYDQLLAAQANVNSQVTITQNQKEARDNAAEQVRLRIRGVIDEMGQVLSPLDARWLAFGFNKPGATETPEIVEGILATLIGATSANLKWKASPRAEYYRVWMKVHGSDGDYAALGSPADLDFTIESLPANSTVDIVVTAVNNGGESPVSDVVTITTH